MHKHALRGGSAASIFAAIPGLRMNLPVADPREGMSALADRFEAHHGEVKTFHSDIKAKVTQTADEVKSLSTRCDEIEAEITKRVRSGGGSPSPQTPGQVLVNDPDFKAAAAMGARWKGQISIEVKTITSNPGSAGSLVMPDISTTPSLLQRRRLRIRDLCAPGRTMSNLVMYPRQVSRTNNAATVAENPSAPKPQSDLTFVQISNTVQTLATFTMTSKQVMADAPLLSSIVDGEIRYMLADLEDQQLLSGDGTGTNLLGIIPQAKAFVKPAGLITQNATLIDTLLAAMAQAELSDYPVTGMVLHPTDYYSLLGLKDTQNRYLASGPMAPLMETLWSTPIVRTRIMTQGSFLLGAFKDAAQILDREDANVQVSTEDRDNFVKNMVTILGEERLTLVVKQPNAFIFGSLTPAAN